MVRDVMPPAIDAAVDHDDLLARRRKLIGDGQAGDAGADDHGVAAQRCLQGAARPGATSCCIQSDRVRSSLAFIVGSADVSRPL